MGSFLRLEQQRKGRIAANINPFDGIHLDGDIEAHGGAMFWVGTGRGELRLKVYAILSMPATRLCESDLQHVASNALTMWRGSLPGTTSMTSKRIAHCASCG